MALMSLGDRKKTFSATAAQKPTSGYAGGSGGSGSWSNALGNAQDWLKNSKDLAEFGQGLADRNAERAFKYRGLEGERDFALGEKSAEANFGRQQRGADADLGRRSQMSAQEFSQQRQMQGDREAGQNNRLSMQLQSQQGMQSERERGQTGRLDMQLRSQQAMQTEREGGQTARQAAQLAAQERMQGKGHEQETNITKLRAGLDSQKTDDAFKRAVSVYKGKF